MSSNSFLDGNVIRILCEKVRHGTGILGLQDRNIGLIIFIRHVVSENLIAISIRNLGIRGIATTTISLDTNLLSSLGCDSELDLVKVSPFLTRGSLQGLVGREFLVGLGTFDVLDCNIIKGHKKSKFVDSHVLEHTLGITLEALTQTLRCGLVGVVRDEGNMRSFVCGSKITCLTDILANIFVVSHKNFNTILFGVISHFFKFSDSGSTRLFKVNSGASMGNSFLQ
mmetsp:Transcript_33/g.66  ORF Transcript_33/g.66 Transcript_33/m.66 type:complete len:226 (-) Transcript_33:343-1020(-)